MQTAVVDDCGRVVLPRDVAEEKIARLSHLRITEEIVSSIVLNPQKVEEGCMNRKIADRSSNRESGPSGVWNVFSDSDHFPNLSQFCE